MLHPFCSTPAHTGCYRRLRTSARVERKSRCVSWWTDEVSMTKNKQVLRNKVFYKRDWIRKTFAMRMLLVETAPWLEKTSRLLCQDTSECSLHHLQSHSLVHFQQIHGKICDLCACLSDSALLLRRACAKFGVLVRSWVLSSLAIQTSKTTRWAWGNSSRDPGAKFAFSIQFFWVSPHAHSLPGTPTEETPSTSDFWDQNRLLNSGTLVNPSE